jgi:hypothetical protein
VNGNIYGQGDFEQVVMRAVRRGRSGGGFQDF